MRPDAPDTRVRSRLRHDLVQQYVRLQRALIDGDPTSSSYHGTIQAFRQLGYMLVASGLENDLDRLLRVRVMPGGRATPVPREERSTVTQLRLVG